MVAIPAYVPCTDAHAIERLSANGRNCPVGTFITIGPWSRLVGPVVPQLAGDDLWEAPVLLSPAFYPGNSAARAVRRLGLNSEQYNNKLLCTEYYCCFRYSV